MRDQCGKGCYKLWQSRSVSPSGRLGLVASSPPSGRIGSVYIENAAVQLLLTIKWFFPNHLIATMNRCIQFSELILGTEPHRVPHRKDLDVWNVQQSGSVTDCNIEVRSVLRGVKHWVRRTRLEVCDDAFPQFTHLHPWFLWSLYTVSLLQLTAVCHVLA